MWIIIGNHVDKLREILFWDFQGTLAHNEWMFSKPLYKVLIKNGSNTEISIEDLKKRPLQGFPWQDYEKEYLHYLCELPGGRMAFGETAEETSFIVEPVKLLDTWNFVATDYQITGVIYLCKIKDRNLKLSDEHDKYEDSNIELNIPLK